MRGDETGISGLTVSRSDRRDATTAAPAFGHRPRTAPSALRERAQAWRRTIAGAWSNPEHWIATEIRHELDAGNGFAWCVVAYALGEVLYLSLPHEPSLWATMTLSILTALAAIVRRHSGHTAVGLSSLALVCLGLVAGQWQAILCGAPALDHDRLVLLTGRITAEETVLKGATRLDLSVTAMEARGLSGAHKPHRVTVTLRASAPKLLVGQTVRMLAKLRPLPGPILPGGYNFARRAYFDGRGATGFALGKIEVVPGPEARWSDRLWLAIADLRHTMAGRIRDALPGAEGAIAAAMIVGEQRGIPDAENDALRMSGLTHIISISGLHMSLVASCVFLVLRSGLALIPSIALRFPTRKWAAIAAMFAASFYMLLAGDAVAAERSYLMCMIMLLSIIFDRPGLTMRNVALSAALLLARDPAQAIEPSFLMSYLAVIALIGGYDAWRQWRSDGPGHSNDPPRRDGPLAVLLQSISRRAVGAMASTLIATIATASVIADQFYRGTPYGLITNLIVLPVIDLIAMPAAVVACLAMPLGLEWWPLKLMGLAIHYMDLIAFWASDLPGGSGLIGRIHPLTNPLAILSVLWLCLWQRPWRSLAIIPAIAALIIAPMAERPDLLIGANATPIAARDIKGTLHILDAGINRFTAVNWLAADADPGTPNDVRAPLPGQTAAGWQCDRLGCSFEAFRQDHSPIRIAVIRHALAFEEDCELADIIITPLTAPDHCRSTSQVYDRVTLATLGATTVQYDRTQKTDDRREGQTQASPSLNALNTTGSLQDPSRPWVRARLQQTPAPVRSNLTGKHLNESPSPTAVGRSDQKDKTLPLSQARKTDRLSGPGQTSSRPDQAVPSKFDPKAQDQDAPDPDAPLTDEFDYTPIKP